VTYSIEVLPAAVRAIRKLPPEAKRRVQGVLEVLADDPRPPAAKKLTARPEWRVRSGDYRVLYRIDDGRLIVVVVDAGHRRSIYDDRR
jgi:mRNA interferase RelE/StbE